MHNKNWNWLIEFYSIPVSDLSMCTFMVNYFHWRNIQKLSSMDRCACLPKLNKVFTRKMIVVFLLVIIGWLLFFYSPLLLGFFYLQNVQNNGSIYIHVFFVKEGMSPDPNDRSSKTYSKKYTAHGSKSRSPILTGLAVIGVVTN